MPTRVRLNCPECGIVETYNYDWPDDQSEKQRCPFCASLADFLACEVVPREGSPSVIEPKEVTDNGKVFRKERKRKSE